MKTNTAAAPYRGRPRLLQARIRVNLTLDSQAQRDKLARLGGAAWVREQIEMAKVPGVSAGSAKK